jgi:hypothetical protein
VPASSVESAAAAATVIVVISSNDKIASFMQVFSICAILQPVFAGGIPKPNNVFKTSGAGDRRPNQTQGGVS